MTQLKNKVALVTGGRSGIGQAIRERLQSEGARVITAQRQPDENCEHIVSDLAETDAAGELIEQIIALTGRLDILINNAGVMREASVQETTLEEWHLQLQVNLTAPFQLIKAATIDLQRTGGCIVNVGSVEGIASNPGHSAYGAAKAGLHGLTRACAVDLGPLGVRCNAVAPGWIDTELNEDFINSMSDPEEFRAGLSDIHPIGRTGSPEDVAGLVVYLASADAAFVTGQIYTIDGGRMTQLSLPSGD